MARIHYENCSVVQGNIKDNISWEPSHALVHDAQCTFHDVTDVEILLFSSIVSIVAS